MCTHQIHKTSNSSKLFANSHCLSLANYFFPSHPDAILCVCVSVCVCTGLEKKTHTQRIISHSDLHLYSHLVRIFFLFIFFPPFSSFFCPFQSYSFRPVFVKFQHISRREDKTPRKVNGTSEWNVSVIVWVRKRNLWWGEPPDRSARWRSARRTEGNWRWTGCVEASGLMANHAIVNASSRTSSPSTTPETLLRSQQMELLPDRPSRIPPVAPARPAAPGAAVRIHGRPTSPPLAVPRVPAPTLPLRQAVSVTTIVTTTNNGSRSATAAEPEVITLSQPRPDGERVRNEYIDTPLKGGLRTSTPLHAETHIHISGSPHDHLALVSPLGSHSSSKTTSSSTKSLPFVNNSSTTTTLLTSPSLKRLQSTRRSLPITKQPPPALPPTKKDASAGCRVDLASTSSSSRMVFSSPGSQSSSGGGDSVICPDCDRCRCLSCRTPRPLPSKWLCGDKCLCSAESCVDYASCLCCVKGLFYHCGSGDEDDDEDVPRSGRRYHQHHPPPSSSTTSCADAPCSCVPSHHRMARWGCLASLTLVLPCLLCYWPLQGGVKVVEMCYQKCTRHGCRCDQQQQQQQRRPPSQQQPTSSKTAVVVQPLPSSGKRLLDI